jgi:Tol biopolymer transport system component/DNA-binding winged helix-turn-helix (wHTH) protein
MDTLRKTAETWRFGVFEFDARSAELRRAGVPIKLRDQSSRILFYFLEYAGQTVTREELRHHLWPSDTFVDFDHSLNTAVMKLREALGDSADKPLYIETIPKKGYRFVAPVERNGDGSTKTALEATANAEVAQVTAGPVHSDETEIAPSTSAASSSTAHPVGDWWKGRRFSVVLGSLLLLLCAGALFFQYLKQNRRSAQFVQPEIVGLESSRNQIQRSGSIPNKVPEEISVPLTVLPGSEISPAFSPDGSQVAFAWDGGRSDGAARFDLYAKVIGSERVEQLTHHSAAWIVPAWSPDGRNIAFAREDAGESGIFMVSARGGPERRLADATFRKYSNTISLNWSPDGRQLLYADIDGMHLLTPENDETRAVPTPPQCSAVYSPAFSPDGQWIAFSCFLDVSYDIHVLPAKGGTSKALIRVKFSSPSPIAWSADSKRIVYSEQWNLFEISSNGGKPQQLMFAHDAFQPAISARGERLAYSQGKININLWQADLRRRGRTSTTLLFPTSRDNLQPDISPDGKRIVFASVRSGSLEIWVSNLDGSDAVKLSDFHSHTGTPRWSPDGQRIVFDSRVSGEAGLYLVDPNTALPKRIATNGFVASVPSWSTDGKWIYFRSGTKEDEGGLYRVSLQGGDPQLVSQTRGYNVQQSKTGSTLYFIAGPQDAAIHVLNITTGEERSLEGMPRVGLPTEWVVGSKGIFFIDRSSAQPSIDFFEFASARVTKRIPLPREPAFWGGLALAPDETWLAYAQIDQSASDLMLIEGFH